jgi:hypothetical protein
MPDVDGLRAGAIAVLRRNDRGTMTTAGPDLYPHQWSWDAAFVAIGLARFDVTRAIVELRSLLAAQWRTGMIPHIVFDPNASAYFPGPDRWNTVAAPAAPLHVRTSGLCQPAVHAIAVAHVLDRGRENGGVDEQRAVEFAAESFDALVAWHRWLSTARDPDGVGLVEIHHGWESGMDNSPRWDSAYARVLPGDMAPFVRRDTEHVADVGERPTDEDYRRYLWLVHQLESVHYDDRAALEVIDFRVRDVFSSAILAAASDCLAEIGAGIGRGDRVGELSELAARFRAGVEDSVDPATGLAQDFDVRAGEPVAGATIGGFAPLVSGCAAALRDRQRRLLLGPDWMASPGLRYPLPPSTSPTSVDFQPRRYWRGPVWPFLDLLLGWAAARDGDGDLAAALREPSLTQLTDDSFGAYPFGEYYEPLTGEPLGSRDQSWTAAAALEWLGQPTT